MGNISTRFSFPNKFLSAAQQLTNSIFQQTNNIVKMSIVFIQRSWIFFTSPKSNIHRSALDLEFELRSVNLRRIKFLMTNIKVTIKGK